MIKWKTTRWNNGIERVECTREAGKTIWVMEDVSCKWRGDAPVMKEFMRRKSGPDSFHDSWKDAHEYLLARAQSSLDSARRSVGQYQEQLNEINAMQEPKQEDAT